MFKNIHSRNARTDPEGKPLSERTRERLLDAAGGVFAERGYRRATAREICRRANGNIASVSYYFKSKEDLYADVLEFAYRQARQKSPETDASSRAGSADRRLSRVVRIFLPRVLAAGRPAWV